jgi:hypothetical protein
MKEAELPLLTLTWPPAATRLSLHPATAWIFSKTRGFPSAILFLDVVSVKKKPRVLP